ncbi:ATP-binding cassette domain-containing protein [Mycoplasma crocodyli]|uniref:ABC transporter, ATP-binding protein n=1 Tax=Mycoplasma crocodyli (strain ATCC 51981 / MP145) TaxID=512564 RepID=D5E5T5_MYCCM|nr:ABC transporter ATP-binding protein [Mycoplasma crocodyli]ADE19456.1 ABC transporter, ATP-binding protein [Mycoplasma crocodyli MP145]
MKNNDEIHRVIYDTSFKNTLKNIFHNPILGFLTIFLKLFVVVLILVETYFLNPLIENIINKNNDEIIKYLIILSAIFAANVVCSISAKFLSLKLELTLKNHLQFKLAEKLSLNNLESWNSISNETKISVYSNIINNIVIEYHLKIIDFIKSIAILIGAILTLGIILPIGLTYVIPIALIAIGLQFLAIPLMNKIGELSNNGNNKFYNSTLKSRENFLLLKRNGFETTYKNIFKKEQEEIQKINKKESKLISLVIFFAVGTANVGLSISVGLTFMLVVYFSYAQIAVIMSLISLMFMIFQNVIGFLEMLGSIIMSKSSFDEINTKLKYKNINYDNNLMFNKEIKIVNESLDEKPYITINKGNKVLVTGDNGSGKSTLAKFLSGNLKIDNIIIKIDNESIVNNDYYSLINNSYLVSNVHYFEKETILENLIFASEKKSSSIKKAYELVDLFNLSHLNLSSKYEEYINLLSEGEKQRIQIIRALLSNKEVIILDESLSNIDKLNRQIVLDYVLNTDRTIIIISHGLNPNSLLDKVVDVKKIHLLDNLKNKEVANEAI